MWEGTFDTFQEKSNKMYKNIYLKIIFSRENFQNTLKYKKIPVTETEQKESLRESGKTNQELLVIIKELNIKFRFGIKRDVDRKSV